MELVKTCGQCQNAVMGKKPKFLWPTSKYGEWFASLGRTLKDMKNNNVADWGVKKNYLRVRELHKERKVTARHYRWLQVYEAAHDEAYARALDELEKTEKQALKYARQKGEQAVLEAFPDEVTTTPGVRKAIRNLQQYD